MFSTIKDLTFVEYKLATVSVLFAARLGFDAVLCSVSELEMVLQSMICTKGNIQCRIGTFRGVICARNCGTTSYNVMIVS